MRAFLDRYIQMIAGIILIAILLAVILGFSPSRNLVCGDPVNCGSFRDWLSALSGWAAVAAAVVTVRTMNQQRAESLRFQREDVELEIMARLALCRKVMRVLYRYRTDCRRAKQRFETSPSRFIGHEVSEYRRLAARLLPVLNDVMLQKFEDEIGFKAARKERPLSWFIQVDQSCATFEQLANDPSANFGQRAVAEHGLMADLSGCYLACSNFFDTAFNDASAFDYKWTARIHQDDLSRDG